MDGHDQLDLLVPNNTIASGCPSRQPEQPRKSRKFGIDISARFLALSEHVERSNCTKHGLLLMRDNICGKRLLCDLRERFDEFNGGRSCQLPSDRIPAIP